MFSHLRIVRNIFPHLCETVQHLFNWPIDLLFLCLFSSLNTCIQAAEFSQLSPPFPHNTFPFHLRHLGFSRLVAVLPLKHVSRFVLAILFWFRFFHSRSSPIHRYSQKINKYTHTQTVGGAHRYSQTLARFLF